MPRCCDSRGWVRLIDTNDPELPEHEFEIGHVYEVTGRSLLLFERKANETKSGAEEAVASV